MARKSATRKSADASAAKVQTRVTVALAVTPDFKAHLEMLAKSEGKSVSVFTAQMALHACNSVYTKQFVGAAVPVRASKARKYLTPEDRKAAIAKNAKERNAKMAALLKALTNGDIGTEILAKYLKTA